MTISKETQAQIAKELTNTFASHLRFAPGVPAETFNATLRVEVSKFYEEMFNTVKRLTEE